MVCPSCNTANRDDAKFCKSCGQPLRPQPATASASIIDNEVPPLSASVQGSSESAPAQGEAEQQLEFAPVQDADDISIAPTLILTPEKMMAYHSRRWQEEMEREQQSLQKIGAEDQAATHTDITDMPTRPVWSEQAQGAVDVAEAPTVEMDPTASNDKETIPPPPQAEMPGINGSVSAGHEESVETSETEAAEVAHEQEESEGMQIPPDQPDTAATASGFPVLPIGTNKLERYEVTQVISDSPQEHVYQVIDHQGYQHCWNCGSEQNAEGDEFCIDCGASLLNMPYIMHEYSTEQGDAETEGHVGDSHVLQGTIVNTFIDQGHTYVIEQPQAEQSAFPNGVQLLAATATDAGNVRRSEPNEDSTLVLLLQRNHESFSMPYGVFIVADGLGGHDNGQVASRMTVNVIADRMVRELLAEPLKAEKDEGSVPPFDEDALIALFRGAIEDANTVLCQKNQLDKTDMGSTITGFMVAGEHAYIINVGDSRTYMLRGKQLYQLTTDHSLVGQLVAGGLIEPDDVYTHPQRSQIFRSLGDKPNVQIDIFKQQLHPGDVLLSCSDGLWEMVRNPQIESILDNAPDPQKACTQLIEAANTNGGEDNISAVIAFVR
ncbi:MAG TPA: protein phosphatase 2C domain-containing protein [Ktedonobacteraceae bacterium]|nr:protein phosphatase 2C domain-containing protein [Ktedonobacteraceae bacterium]